MGLQVGYDWATEQQDGTGGQIVYWDKIWLTITHDMVLTPSGLQRTQIMRLLNWSLTKWNTRWQFSTVPPNYPHSLQACSPQPSLHHTLPPHPQVFLSREFQILALRGFRNVCYCYSLSQTCLALCNPIDCSTPGLPVLHYLPEFVSNSCPSSWWCYPTISSSVVPFSSCLQSFPASGSFPKSQFFPWGDQSIGASASAAVLPMNI